MFIRWSRKLGDGLFLQCCKEVASGYPEITFDSMIVDNTTMQVATGRPRAATLLVSLRGTRELSLNGFKFSAATDQRLCVCVSWFPGPSSST